ncbi:MAG: macro domain-containing protein [Peptostreptococcaceae bacterium]|nr:macro domain-containing protein [Peptostreptococcaceae bacterium]
MPLYILRNDITAMEVDAVVNAANTDLVQGGGVCGAIFRKAGAKELARECASIGGCKTGEAVITGAYALPARYIIHTAGPIWQGGGSGEEELLYSSYASSLRLAAEKGCESIAFPLISSGIYGYPKKEALRIAKKAVLDFLEAKEMKVYLTLFDKEALEIGKSLEDSIRSYIDDRYVDIAERSDRGRRLNEELPLQEKAEPASWERSSSAGRSKKDEIEERRTGSSLDELISKVEEGFSQTLLRMIDERGLSDVQVYKKANIDRKHFSKIRSKKDYMPKKGTVLSLSIAMELSLEETRYLLSRAGYALSHSSKSDIIVEYFIENKNYDIFLINETLFSFEQQTLI